MNAGKKAAIGCRVMYASIIAFLMIIVAILQAAEPPRAVATQYFHHWQAGEYEAMFDMLSLPSRIFISCGEFVARQRNFAQKYIIDDIEILDVVIQGQTASVEYRLHLIKIGGENTIEKGTIIIIKDDGRWRIVCP